MSTGEDVDWNEAWERTLTELELDVAQSELLLTSSHRDVELRRKPWVPPQLPPLPASMVERARALMDRQMRVSAQLAEAARESRRHGRAVHKLKAGPAARPVYIDTPA